MMGREQRVANVDPEIPASQHIRSSLAFLADLKLYLEEKPYFMLLSKDRHCDSVLTNLVHDVYQEVLFTDIRGYEGCFKLDVHGFELQKHITSLQDQDFDNSRLVCGIYYAEIETYLKKLLGAERVRVMQHTIRERPHDFVETGGQSQSVMNREKPLTAIHVDASAEGAVKRIERLLPDEVDTIRGRRFQIVNVWRPLSESLRDWPLALCDARSVQPEDMVESDLIWPGYLGENLFLYFNPHYKFYFLDKQTRDEVWIFKQFDTNECVARNCPHGAFQDPRTADSANARVSIDVAALVVY